MLPLVPRITLLGVPLDSVTMVDALLRLRAMLKEDKAHHVMTPNSEMLVEASRNPAFREILNHTVLNVPDSAGLLWTARWTGQRLPERVAGVDLVERLCSHLPHEDTVFLLGGEPGVAQQAAQKIQTLNPHLSVVGTYAGSPRPEDAPAILERIRATKPRILLVAYGAPKQDMWIDRHLKDLPSVRIAMGVGGTFDFLAGTQKRAPKLFRVLSLEWLWRLMREPARFKRIWTAVIIFPMLVLQNGKEVPHAGGAI